MSLRPCPACKGARLKPESRAVLVGGVAIHELTALSVKRALQWLADVQLSETERHIARLIMRAASSPFRFRDRVKSCIAVFHAAIGELVLPTIAHVLAIVVCSAVRVVLLTAPIAFTSLKSVA